MKTPMKEMFQILSLRKMHFQTSVKTWVENFVIKNFSIKKTSIKNSDEGNVSDSQFKKDAFSKICKNLGRKLCYKKL